MFRIAELLKENETVMQFYEEYGPQIRKMAVICLIGFVLFAGFSLFNGSGEELAVDTKSGEHVAAEPAEGSTELPSGSIFVDIGGAVNSPMLAELPDGSRVEDAIEAAGGLKKEADMSSVNRAEYLIDGQKIYIPSLTLDEDGNVVQSAESAAAGSGSDKVNINSADADQLQTLSGVGPATAQKIIDYRQSNGSFASVEDIKNVSGIGDKTYEKLRDHITV